MPGLPKRAGGFQFQLRQLWLGRSRPPRLLTALPFRCVAAAYFLGAGFS